MSAKKALTKVIMNHNQIVARPSNRTVPTHIIDCFAASYSRAEKSHHEPHRDPGTSPKLFNLQHPFIPALSKVIMNHNKILTRP